MRTAVILHSVPDAQHCVANKLYEGNIIFSTHSSVDIFLKEKHGIDCRCLSKFMSTEELTGRRNALSDAIDGLLRDMDSRISPSINCRYKLELNYFMPLYSFCGKHHLLGYKTFTDCVRKAVDKLNLERVMYYDRVLSQYLDVSTTVGDLLGIFFKDIRTEVIKIPENAVIKKAKTNFRNIADKLEKLRRCNFKFIMDKVAAKRCESRFRRFNGDRKTILMSGLLYELEFLRGYVSRYNVMYYDFAKEKFLGFKKDYENYCIDLDTEYDAFLRNYNDPILRLFIKDIREDFANNISQCLNAIYLIEKNSRQYPIALGIWGVTPAWKTRAMIFEYLRSKKIKVLGSQHGCLYGEIFYPWHFDLDFNRCDSFISWGFTEEDLKRTYPSKKIDTEIFPFGKVEVVKNRKVLKKIDILFPITYSLSMFYGGMARVFPDKLTEIQVTLLEYLNSLNLPDVYVKPVMGSDHTNCSVLPVLKRLKNLKVVDNISLTDFLRMYSPRAVLSELPSSPLFDALPLDTEIFLMGDPLNPYEKKALEELKRRAHYCEDVDDVISKMGLFLKGKLEKKRDDTFYRHYMYKENTKEKILDLVKGLVSK